MEFKTDNNNNNLNAYSLHLPVAHTIDGLPQRLYSLTGFFSLFDID
jgi:hypothetical protein